MQASIIICTYNRADSLKKTLDALKILEVPTELSLEIIIVDNNSTDYTHTLVESYMQNMNNLRYAFQKEQGLSHARNMGIDLSNGDILLFTDDDVCPEHNWLKETIANMDKHECDACGGYIAPAWEAPPPKWLTERFYGFLAIKTDNEAYSIEQGGNLPFGANMAFRSDVFTQLGKFDTSRGRIGQVLASGEDGEMFERIISAGKKVMYFPSARVHHKIESFRIRKRYFRKWRYQTSFNLAQSKGVDGDHRILGIPYYIFPQLLRAISNTIISKLTKQPDESFNREIIVWHFFGMISGLFQSRNIGPSRH